MTAPPLPSALDAWLAPLALSGDTDVERAVRRAQLRAAAQGAPLLFAAQIAAICGVLAMLPSPAADIRWSGWAVVGVLVALILFIRRRRAVHADNAAAVGGSAIDGIALGAMWGGAMWLAAPLGGGTTVPMLWTFVCALALAIAAVRLAALTLGFVAAAVAGAAVPLWAAAGPV
ncbi:hypothetical protein, partial [Sphingomonas ginsenosidimutans]|uniref:hypothetical protein n=2 Tax=Sphingomonas TaxID=13687 RepID=UPI001DF0151C